MQSVEVCQVTVIGSINEDVIARASSLPRPGETVGGGRLSRQTGGKGANQAIAAALLGAAVSLVGAVGDDEPARRILESLRSSGIDTTDVSAADLPTGTALIVVDDAGENQIAVCPGANYSVTADSLRIASAKLVLAQLEIPLETVLAASRAATGYFALNASPAQELPQELVERCNVIVVNETEYSAMPDLDRAPLLVVTLGAEGAILLERGREIARVPAVAAKVVNTVGAGDAFFAALAVSLASGREHVASLRIAAAVGAAAVASDSSHAPLARLEAYEEATSR